MTTAMKYTLDVNSNTNQDIKGKFVGIHVYDNVNSMVEYILRKGFEDSDAPFSHDDIENLYEPQRPEENQIRYIVNLNERGEFSADFYSIDEDGNDSEASLMHIDTEAAKSLSDEGINVEDGEAVAEYYADLNNGIVFGKKWTNLTFLEG